MIKRLFSFLLASILMTCICLSAFAADSQGGLFPILSVMCIMVFLIFKTVFLTPFLGMSPIRLLVIQNIVME